MKKKILFFLGVLLFVGLMVYNLGETQASTNSAAISISNLAFMPTMAVAEGGGMVCNSGSNCLANYSDGPDPVDKTNVCCISYGTSTGQTQS